MKRFFALSLAGFLCFGLMGCQAEAPVVTQVSPAVTAGDIANIPPPAPSTLNITIPSKPTRAPTPPQPQITFSSTQLENMTLTDADVVLDNKYVLSLGMSKRECLNILEKSGVEFRYDKNSGEYKLYYNDGENISDFLHFDEQDKLDSISLRKEYSKHMRTARGLDTSCSIGFISRLYGTEGTWDEVNQKEAIVRIYSYDMVDSFISIFASLNDLEGQNIYLINISRKPHYNYDEQSRDLIVVFDIYGDYNKNAMPHTSGEYNISIGCRLELYQEKLDFIKIFTNKYDVRDKDNELLCTVITDSSHEIINIETEHERASTYRGLFIGSFENYMEILYGTKYNIIESGELAIVEYNLSKSFIRFYIDANGQISKMILSLK